jgi:hypothetical protein
MGLAIALGFSVSSGEYFMTTKRECAHCGERFSLVQRSGRDSYRARAGRERSFHQEQRYCSATCRKLASKARQARSGTPVNGPVSGPPMRDKASQGIIPSSDVTTAPAPISLATIYGGQKSTGPTLQMNFRGYTVVPDPEWPAMYRVRRPDGSFTGMANLTRARDAARCFAEQERRQEPLAIAA